MAKVLVAERADDPRNDDPGEFLVDENRALALLGGKDSPIHRSTLWRGINDGRYPPPIKVGPNTNRWDRRQLARVVEAAASKGRWEIPHVVARTDTRGRAQLSHKPKQSAIPLQRNDAEAIVRLFGKSPDLGGKPATVRQIAIRLNGVAPTYVAGLLQDLATGRSTATRRDW